MTVTPLSLSAIRAAFSNIPIAELGESLEAAIEFRDYMRASGVDVNQPAAQRAIAATVAIVSDVSESCGIYTVSQIIGPNILESLSRFIEEEV